MYVFTFANSERWWKRKKQQPDLLQGVYYVTKPVLETFHLPNLIQAIGKEIEYFYNAYKANSNNHTKSATEKT